MKRHNKYKTQVFPKQSTVGVLNALKCVRLVWTVSASRCQFKTVKFFRFEDLRSRLTKELEELREAGLLRVEAAQRKAFTTSSCY